MRRGAALLVLALVHIARRSRADFCDSYHTVRLDLAGDTGSGGTGLLVDQVPGRACPLVSGVVVGGPAATAGVQVGSCIAQVGVTWLNSSSGADPVAEMLQHAVLGAAAADRQLELTLCAPAAIGSFAAPSTQPKGPAADHRRGPKAGKGRRGRNSKEAKSAATKQYQGGRRAELTKSFHAKIWRFQDLPGAVKMLKKHPDRIDFERGVESAPDPRLPKPLAGMPALHYVMHTFQSMPLRLRPLQALEMAELLVDAGVDVNHIGEFPVGPLGLAVLCKALPLVRKLLRAGASTETSSPMGGVLHFAFAQRELSIMLVRELQVLSQAARNGRLDEVQRNALLLDVSKLSPTMYGLYNSIDGAQQTFKASDTWRSVHEIQVSVVTSLMAHSSEPSVLLQTKDQWSRTPLHLAVRGGNIGVLRLLHFGPVLLMQDRFGRSALHLAAMQGAADVSVVPELIKIVQERYPEKLEALLQLKDDGGRVYTDYALSISGVGASVNVEESNTSPASLATNGGGGWGQAALKEWSSPRSDVQVVDGMLDSKRFLRDFLKPGRPVLMRGAAKDWKWTRDWTKDKFIRNFGRRTFTVGGIPYPKIFGLPTKDVSASDYVRDMAAEDAEIGAQPYVFHSINGPEDELLNAFPMFPDFLQAHPGIIDTDRPKAVQFFLGSAGSGAPVHYHCDAWNGIAFGQKRWFLYPPARALFGQKHIGQWLLEDYNTSGTIEVVQEAGDILYVPCEWGHAVLNTRETIGAAVEFVYRYADGT